ncbi:MAG: PfkB family carbohydrate kinase [Cyanobacteria bacterium P01_F01_bin.42]
MKPVRGLFIGLTTLDLIYHAHSAPSANEKVVAQEMMFAAGGPATNAAIAFAALGGEATLVSVIGQHPLAQWIHSDLAQHQVAHLELMPQYCDSPTVSSVVVSTETGDRAVVSKNAQDFQVADSSVIVDQIVSLFHSADIIILDGHQMALSQAIAARAAQSHIPTVFDGGSWKPGSEHLLPHITHIICSESFQPPGCGNEFETLAYLGLCSPGANLAVTHGGAAITLRVDQAMTRCSCPSVTVADTLGAGDFLHGAFAFWVPHRSFEASIQAASTIASLSCQFPGTRKWLSKISAQHYS